MNADEVSDDGLRRCAWAGEDPRMREYHDVEWGVPQHDRVRLFEKLCLEGAQAGLSWRTILNKREGYRACFAGFEPAKVARFTDARVEKLLGDARIVRNRAKVTSVVDNAKAVLRLEREQAKEGTGDLADYLWSFVDAGWDGHLTLELSNVANLPIALYPGMKIGQISFFEMTTAAEHPYGSAEKGSKYQGQRGPTPSRYYLNFRDGS